VKSAVRITGLVLMAVGCASGCSKRETAVSGTVRYQGRPLPGGSVILYCENKQIVHGLIGPAGEYAIPNVPLGQVRVTVRTHALVPDGFRLTTKLPPVVDGPISPTAARPKLERVPAIPVRYSLPEESDLSFRADGADVTYDIDLLP
jgi:hypothetical protein